VLLDVERMKANVVQAETEDLLDRITIFRAGMEEAALAFIEEELRKRGIGSAAIEEHEEERRKNLIPLRDGYPARCGECFRPAVECVVDWHWVFDLVPLFRRKYYYCERHRPVESVPPVESPAETENASDA
jgi:hypothetical protein